MNARLAVSYQMAMLVVIVLFILPPVRAICAENPEDKVVRTQEVKVENASFSGNSITEVKGTGEIKDEQGATIAKGNLLMVDGWIALQCPKGAKFKLLPKLDTDSQARETWPKDANDRPAAVTLNQRQEWEIQDDNFFFLVDTSYGLVVDFASSFARDTNLKVPYPTELTLWGSKVTVGKDGGAIRVVHGKIVGGQNITVTSPDGKIAFYKNTQTKADEQSTTKPEQQNKQVAGELPFAILCDEIPARPPFGTEFVFSCKDGSQFLVVAVRELRKEEALPSSELNHVVTDQTGTTFKPVAFGFPPRGKTAPFLISGFSFTGSIKLVDAEKSTFGLVFVVPKTAKAFTLTKSGAASKPLDVLKNYAPPESSRIDGYLNNGKVEFGTPTIKENGWGLKSNN